MASSGTPSWWSNPLSGDLELSLSVEAPQQSLQQKLEIGGAIAEVEPGPSGNRTSDAPDTEATFGMWEGSEATERTASGLPSKLPNASFADWAKKGGSPVTVHKSCPDTSKAVDVSLAGWAQEQQGEEGGNAGRSKLADASFGSWVKDKSPGTVKRHASVSKAADVSLAGWGQAEQREDMTEAAAAPCNLPDASFGDWQKSTKTPGATTAGKSKGNRVSFAAGAADAEEADTPVLGRGSAAAAGTPAVSVAGSCSASGQTPGSVLSTGAVTQTAPATTAQCSVRGQFVTRGAASSRRPRSSVPAPPKFDGTASAVPESAAEDAIHLHNPEGQAGAESAQELATGAAVTHVAADVAAETVQHGQDKADAAAAALPPASQTRSGRARTPEPKAFPKRPAAAKPVASAPTGPSAAAAATAQGKPAAPSDAAAGRKVVLAAAVKAPSRIPGPPKSPVGTKNRAAAGGLRVPAGGKTRSKTPPAAGRICSKTPPKAAAPVAAANPTRSQRPPAASADPSAGAATNQFKAWLSATGASLHSPGVNLPVSRTGAAAKAEIATTAAPLAAAAPADATVAPKVPTDQVLTQHHGPKARTGLKAATDKPRASAAASSSVGTAGLSKALFASEDGSVVEQQEQSTAVVQAEADQQKEVMPTAVSIKQSPRTSSRRAAGTASQFSPKDAAATAAASPATASQLSPKDAAAVATASPAVQEKEFSFGHAVSAAAKAVASVSKPSSRSPGQATRSSPRGAASKAAAAAFSFDNAPAASAADTVNMGSVVTAAVATSPQPAGSISFAGGVGDGAAHAETASTQKPAGSISFGGGVCGAASAGKPASSISFGGRVSAARAHKPAGSVSFGGGSCPAADEAYAEKPAGSSGAVASAQIATASVTLSGEKGTASASSEKPAASISFGAVASAQKPAASVGFGVAATPGPAATAVTAVTAEQTASFGMIADFGRFAPLMGVPSNFKMTPDGQSTPGVSGPASQLTARLACAIAKAASAMKTAGRTPAGPRALTPASPEGSVLATAGRAGKPATGRRSLLPGAVSGATPAPVTVGGSPAAERLLPSAPASTPVAGASSSLFGRSFAVGTTSSVVARPDVTPVVAAARNSAASQGTPAVLMSVATQLAVLAAAAEADGEAAAAAATAAAAGQYVGPAIHAEVAAGEKATEDYGAEAIAAAQAAADAGQLAPLQELADVLGEIAAAVAAGNAAGTTMVAATLAATDTSKAKPQAATDSTQAAAAVAKMTCSEVVEGPKETTTPSTAARQLDAGMLPTPPPPLWSLADELAAWQAAGVLATGNTPAAAAGASPARSPLGLVLSVALEQAQNLLGNAGAGADAYEGCTVATDTGASADQAAEAAVTETQGTPAMGGAENAATPCTCGTMATQAAEKATAAAEGTPASEATVCRSKQAALPTPLAADVADEVTTTAPVVSTTEGTPTKGAAIKAETPRSRKKATTPASTPTEAAEEAAAVVPGGRAAADIQANRNLETAATPGSSKKAPTPPAVADAPADGTASKSAPNKAATPCSSGKAVTPEPTAEEAAVEQVTGTQVETAASEEVAPPAVDAATTPSATAAGDAAAPATATPHRGCRVVKVQLAAAAGNDAADNKLVSVQLAMATPLVAAPAGASADDVVMGAAAAVPAIVAHESNTAAEEQPAEQGTTAAQAATAEALGTAATPDSSAELPALASDEQADEKPAREALQAEAAAPAAKTNMKRTSAGKRARTAKEQQQHQGVPTKAAAVATDAPAGKKARLNKKSASQVTEAVEDTATAEQRTSEPQGAAAAAGKAKAKRRTKSRAAAAVAEDPAVVVAAAAEPTAPAAEPASTAIIADIQHDTKPLHAATADKPPKKQAKGRSTMGKAADAAAEPSADAVEAERAATNTEIQCAEEQCEAAVRSKATKKQAALKGKLSTKVKAAAPARAVEEPSTAAAATAAAAAAADPAIPANEPVTTGTVTDLQLEGKLQKAVEPTNKPARGRTAKAEAVAADVCKQQPAGAAGGKTTRGRAKGKLAVADATPAAANARTSSRSRASNSVEHEHTGDKFFKPSDAAAAGAGSAPMAVGRGKRGAHTHVQFADDAGGELEQFQDCPPHLLLTPEPTPAVAKRTSKRGKVVPTVGAEVEAAQDKGAGSGRPGKATADGAEGQQRTAGAAGKSRGKAAEAAKADGEEQPAAPARKGRAKAAILTEAVPASAAQQQQPDAARGRGKRGAAAAAVDDTQQAAATAAAPATKKAKRGVAAAIEEFTVVGEEDRAALTAKRAGKGKAVAAASEARRADALHSAAGKANRACRGKRAAKAAEEQQEEELAEAAVGKPAAKGKVEHSRGTAAAEVVAAPQESGEQLAEAAATVKPAAKGKMKASNRTGTAMVVELPEVAAAGKAVRSRSSRAAGAADEAVEEATTPAAATAASQRKGRGRAASAAAEPEQQETAAEAVLAKAAVRKRKGGKADAVGQQNTAQAQQDTPAPKRAKRGVAAEAAPAACVAKKGTASSAKTAAVNAAGHPAAAKAGRATRSRR